jgi:hypothetical protein
MRRRCGSRLWVVAAAFILSAGSGSAPVLAAVVHRLPPMTERSRSQEGKTRELPADPGLPMGSAHISSQLPQAASLMGGDGSKTIPPPVTSAPPSDDGRRSEELGDTAPGSAPENPVGPPPQMLEVSPVPEPSTALLMGAAGSVALARRPTRARRRQAML